MNRKRAKFKREIVPNVLCETDPHKIAAASSALLGDDRSDNPSSLVALGDSRRADT